MRFVGDQLRILIKEPVADFDKRTRCRELTFGARSSILDRFDFCAGLAAGFFLSGKGWEI